MVEITKNQDIRVANIASSLLGHICIGGAKVLKGAGIAIGTVTGIVSGGLRLTADGIDYAGGNTASFLFTKSDELETKGNGLKAVNADIADKQEKLNAVFETDPKDLINQLKDLGVKISIDPATLANMIDSEPAH